MLIRFEASNHRSIHEPVELSMVAIDRDRGAAHDVPLLGEGLLSVAAIYGSNASGKSNVVAALAWLRDAIQHSVRLWEDEIPTEPFAFGSGPAEGSSFVFEATVDGVRFEYVLELDAESVEYEGLFHYPEKKRRRIFEREGLDLKLQRGLGHLSGTRELLSPRSLALSVARRFDDPLVSGFANEVRKGCVLGPLPGRQLRRNSRGYSDTIYWFDEETSQQTLFDTDGLEGPHLEDRGQALGLLRLADLGIEDVIVDKEEVLRDTSSRSIRQYRVRLMHRVDSQSIPLDYDSESEGTRAWFRLIGPILGALKTGSMVLLDELDASLHPALTPELVRLFKDPGINPYGAQLVFTTHDTNLLNYLNRDEVWLTEKRSDGSSRLGALAEYAGARVRRSQNLENAYLHGRFGALPQVDQAGLLRALGLIG